MTICPSVKYAFFFYSNRIHVIRNKNLWSVFDVLRYICRIINFNDLIIRGCIN